VLASDSFGWVTMNSGQKDPKIIHLNIGGVRYTTTEGTLCHYGTNYFSGLLSGQFPALVDETGAYFIDRNGIYFEPILDFLRSGELQIPSNTLQDKGYCKKPSFI